MADNPAKTAIVSLAAEVVIQTNATLHDLVVTPDLPIDGGHLRALREMLAATERLAAIAHFNGDPKAGLATAGHRGRTAAQALDTARHYLSILHSLHGPQEARP